MYYLGLEMTDMMHFCSLSLQVLYFVLGHSLAKFWGFPGGSSGKESTCQCRRHKRHRFSPWVGKSPWRSAWQSTSVSLLGESHGQRSLMGYCTKGCKESDMTEVTQHACTSIYILGLDFQVLTLLYSSIVNSFTLDLVKIKEQRLFYASVLFLLLFLWCKGDRKQEKENITSQPRLSCISEEFSLKTGPNYLWMCWQISNKVDSRNQIPGWEVVWEAAPSQSKQLTSILAPWLDRIMTWEVISRNLSQLLGPLPYRFLFPPPAHGERPLPSLCSGVPALADTRYIFPLGPVSLLRI